MVVRILLLLGTPLSRGCCDGIICGPWLYWLYFLILGSGPEVRENRWDGEQRTRAGPFENEAN